MPPRARLLALVLASIHLAVALAPCVGGKWSGPAVMAASLEEPPAPATPLSVRRACHCGCERGPAALVVAGTHVAPPPSVLRVAVPRLRHAAPEPVAALPAAPPRAIDHVPLPA